MKNISCLLILLVVLFSSCNGLESPIKDEVKAEADTSEPVSKISYAQLAYITAYNFDCSGALRTTLDQLILDSLLVQDYFLNESTVPDEQLEKVIEVYQLSRSRYLTTVEYYNPFGPEGLYGEMSIVDAEAAKVIYTHQTPGSKYHTPTFLVQDLDGDGSLEVRVDLILPTSSVPVIGKYETIFEIDEQQKAIVQVLELEVESIDCASRHLAEGDTEQLPGNLIRRAYQFVSPTEVEITEERFQFDCEEFDDSPKASKRRVFLTTTMVERSDDNSIFR